MDGDAPIEQPSRSSKASAGAPPPQKTLKDKPSKPEKNAPPADPDRTENGRHVTDKRGNKLCRNYNKGTCTRSLPGNVCYVNKHMRHFCNVCRDTHSAVDCPKLGDQDRHQYGGGKGAGAGRWGKKQRGGWGKQWGQN